ncbi:receptor-like serine/threonine-protein kinase ALE2 isoform X2 [Ziziphus jujuba]|uniref:Receptor-like serine/threonine-protein kinase ALE2 isoform X2 n=1 Tax=Ziziphus jujuba TaxID=326968 RepID=A0A6P6GDP2_ZIZJJ|nr:receptor-like serine/threonine-protein kinase ALE2 isoform X2 [Ziziphus jujuba]
MGEKLMPMILQLLNLCLISFSLAVQGSTGFDISPSPVISSVIPPNPVPGVARPVHHHSPSSVPQPIGSVSHPALALPPILSAPASETIKGPVPSSPPSTPRVFPPFNRAPLPITVQGLSPSLPPAASQRNTSVTKAPIPMPVAPVPVATPSGNLPQVSPAIHSITPETSPSSAHQRNSPDNKVPIAEPITPVSVAPPPRKLRQHPPEVHEITPLMAPSTLPGRVASPPKEVPQSSPQIHSATPGQAPSRLPAPPPSINWKRDKMPVAAPSYKTPHLSPLSHTPASGPTSALAPSKHGPVRPSNIPRPPLFLSPESPNKGYHPPVSSPSTSIHIHQHTRNKSSSPAPASYFVSPPTSTQQGPNISSGSRGTSRHIHAPPPLNPGSSPSPLDNPSPPPLSFVSPAPYPSPDAASRNTRSSSAPRSDNPFPAPLSHVAPAPSPSQRAALRNTKISPPQSSPKSANVSPLPPLALPPPPPNEDCSATICTDPYTNTPPGSPCGCVMPIQVGLRVNVALYTFFPLVSELAKEIAAGVFVKQSQVRIIGANAADEQPEKTVVLIDLVPLGEKFDNTTALLTYQRFWHKQVAIQPSYFGDYEVLYVRYPGLPEPPPSSDASMIDDGPYSGTDSNGRTIKPLGVDVPKRQHKDGLSTGIIVIIILSASLAVILFSAAAWFFLLKHKDRVCKPAPTSQVSLPSFTKPSGTAGSMLASRHSSASLSFGSSIATYTGSAKTFSINDIERATELFDASRVLGEGGFGRVYSGVLEDGTKVAVKVLKRDDQQGGREFLAEVEMLSRLHHRNLVKLIGICTEERSRCLVYELIPNGSVESHLHGVDKETAPLNWVSRIKIALGAARGLAYLHEDSSPRVIHRDFKSSNILLEDDFTPKVSDFGLARTAMDEENRHISTRVMGTFGYVAPEYAMTGHLLVKSDVYSYGVVLLELLTGRKPVDMSQPPGQENLVAWARPLLTSKEGLETIVDPSLGSDAPFESVAKVAAIASMCVQPEVSHRPFMGEVVQALKLVCNEFEKESSRSTSQEELSIDLGGEASTASGQLPNILQSQYSVPHCYEPELDTERGMLASDLYIASGGLERGQSESFRRHSSSGPLASGSGRGRQFWQRVRSLSGGGVGEHGLMFKFWPGSQ